MTKVEKAIYMKEWRAKKLLEDPDYNKKQYEKQKEYQKEYQKEWQQSPEGKKSNTIAKWKERGLISDNYDQLYEHYIDTHKCDVCQYVFDEFNRRCMDHDHETKLFRQILCHRCNVHDSWKKIKH